MVNDSDLTSWVNNLRDETIWRNAKILLRSTDDQIVVLMDGCTAPLAVVKSS